MLEQALRLTQVGADPASPGGYAARVAQSELGIGMLCEQEPPGLLNKSLGRQLKIHGKIERKEIIKKIIMNKLEEGLSNQRKNLLNFFQRLVQKPKSLLVSLSACVMLGLTLFELGRGNLYLARLNYVDITTMAMVSLLIIRAVMKLQSSSDLETISIVLVSTLSFLFSYEAIYKWSFYFFPWKMPAQELRELLLQTLVGLTLLTGFAQHLFKMKRTNQFILGIFIVTWISWLLIGFPQIWDGENIHYAVIDLSISKSMIYALNRATKILWFMFHYCLYV